MTDLEAKIPFNLLERCTRKAGPDGYHHEVDCHCAGSGMMPTSAGYEVIALMHWVVNSAPNRLSQYAPERNTLDEHIRYIVAQQDYRIQQRKELFDRRRRADYNCELCNGYGFKREPKGDVDCSCVGKSK
jgi:hypothetical protein